MADGSAGPGALAELGARWTRARAQANGSLRALFDHSRKLAGGFVRFHRWQPGPDWLPRALSQLAAPCLRGAWREDGDGFVLRRSPCPGVAAAATCDGWREAIDGLVTGLSPELTHARHRSAGHGDAECVDVLYRDARSPLRFGPLPPDAGADLARVGRLVEQFDGAAIDFLGVSEGRLHYRLSTPRGGDRPIRQIVERCLRRRLPALEPCESSDTSPFSRPEPV